MNLSEPFAEKAVIGAALQRPELAPELRLDWFDDHRRRSFAEVLIEKYLASKFGDIPTLTAELDPDGKIGVFAMLCECDDACHSTANFPEWREKLTGASILRASRGVAQNLIFNVENRNGETPAEILETFEREVLAIRQAQGTAGDGDPVDIKQALNELTDEYEQSWRDGKPPGLATGFADLDKLLFLREQQLIVIAARPSGCKTALASNIAEGAALDRQIPVGFFSLEMGAKELLDRLACSRARVDGSKLRLSRPSDAEMKKLSDAHRKLSRAPLYIVDKGGLSIAQLSAFARRLKQKHSIKLLIVDYLGLLRSGEKGRSRYEETTLVSNALKAIAKELRVPVIALCQLNRDNDREGRVPRLSDLRDSGAIEQDADAVLLLHRDEKQTGNDQTINVIVAKQRNGRTGKVDLLFRSQFTRFENISPNLNVQNASTLTKPIELR